MKKILLALAIGALFLPAVPQAQGADVSVDFFYNNVSGGNWIEVGDYGYCWQPEVAVSNPNWRPYSDGYWTYTDLGWTWVSYEDFGWATYHYGRWIRLSDRGWVWVVGRDSELEWGPAWVSWRTGGNYVGWAPLPPRGRTIHVGGAIRGHVDIDFDIGPSYYNFIEVRYIGEPVLRERIIESRQNVIYINQTVNVTNITYKNKVVYNYGPDINVVSARSSRPIQRLTLERQANVDFSVAAKSGGMTKVEGNKLVVGAPLVIKKPAKPVAPPVIKEKVAQAKIDKGWSGVSDPKAQEDLKKKMQTEDATKIPTPSASASVAAQTGAGASPSPATSPSPAVAASPAASPSVAAATANPAISASPKTSVPPTRMASPATSASPKSAASPAGMASPAASASPTAEGRGKRGDLAKPTTSPAVLATATPATTPSGAKGQGKLDRGTPDVTASPVEESAKTKLGAPKSEATAPPPNLNKEKEAGIKDIAPEKEKGNQLDRPSPTPRLGADSAKQGGPGPVESAKAPGSTGAAPSGEREKIKAAPEGGKKPEKKGEESPAPTP